MDRELRGLPADLQQCSELMVALGCSGNAQRDVLCRYISVEDRRRLMRAKVHALSPETGQQVHAWTGGIISCSQRTHATVYHIN